MRIVRVARQMLLATLCVLAPHPGPWTPPSPAWSSDIAIPEMTLWEDHMIAVGKQMCDYFATTGLTLDQRLGQTYYDMSRVMYQIADHTEQAFWADCAQTASRVYRDEYVTPNG